MKQMDGNALKAKKVGMGMGRWGDISFSLKNISSFEFVMFLFAKMGVPRFN